jgi:hypothetical protein
MVLNSVVGANCLIYLEDIMLSSNYYTDHLKLEKRVLKILIDNELVGH